MAITTHRTSIINTRKPVVADFMNMSDTAKEGDISTITIPATLQDDTTYVSDNDLYKLIDIIKKDNEYILKILQNYNEHILDNIEELLYDLLSNDLDTLGTTIGVKQLLTNTIRNDTTKNSYMSIFEDTNIMGHLEHFIIAIILMRFIEEGESDAVGLLNRLMDDDNYIDSYTYGLALTYLLDHNVNVKDSAKVIDGLLGLANSKEILRHIPNVKQKMIDYIRSNDSNVDMSNLIIKITQLEDEGYLEFTGNAIIIKNIEKQLHDKTPQLPTLQDVSNTLDYIKMIYLIGVK